MPKMSSIFRKDDSGFDPSADYDQVLKEAREHMKDRKTVEAFSKTKRVEERTMKKSWASSLFFWRKYSDKKNKPQQASIFPVPSNALPALKPRHGTVSGPIYGNRERVTNTYRSKRPTSGPIYGREQCVTHSCGSNRPASSPLAGFFSPLRKGEGEIPYTSLGQRNQASVTAVGYGPIYLVT